MLPGSVNKLQKIENDSLGIFYCPLKGTRNDYFTDKIYTVLNLFPARFKKCNPIRYIMYS